MMKHNGYRWTEGEYQVTRSICWSPPGCHGGCGVLLYTKGGELCEIEGDADNKFNTGKLCVRGLTLKEIFYHPQRLKYPLLRAGKRGENRWKNISWEEGLNLVAEKLNRIKSEFGAESVIFAKGTARDIGGWLPRLCYGFGSPNYFGFGPANGNACYRPRVAVSNAILGGFPVADLGQFDYSEVEGFHPPKCILIWGANPIYSNPDGLFGGKIVDLLKQGTDLIVVDPQATWLASHSKYWLRVKPGADSALALGMLKILFEENLYDKDFCSNRVAGWDELQRVVKDIDSETIAQFTGVETRILKEATRHFAKRKPANLVWGVGVDQHSDCVDTIHCLIALITITGNIGIPGGMVFSLEPFGVKRRGDAVEDFPEVKLQAIGLKEYPLMGIGNPYGQPDILLEQMGADEPYPIKGAWIQGAGIIPSGFADPHRVWRLFKKLDFIVIVDIFLNPASVALADIIFPAAMFPEKDSIYVHYSQLGAINKAIEPLGESKSDAEIILLIGKKIAPKYFPWNNVIEWLDYRLKPAGMNFAELREIGSLIPKIRFQNENVDLRTENLHGFRTHSGKIEIYSTLLEKFGLSPLPRFRPDAYRIPEEAREKYPFILTTGARKPYFFCAEHRQSATARRFQPQPEVFINSAVASKLKINNGDKVKIFSPFGSCIMTAKITERFIPEVIHCDSGWWFPEREGREPELFGVDECNVNALFPSGLQGESGFGYPFKSYFCNVEKIGI